MAIFAFSQFTVAGDYRLVGAVTTITVVTVGMAEVGAWLDRQEASAQAGALAPRATSGFPFP